MIVVRPRVAPQTGKVGRGAQFEQAGFLAVGGIDRLEKARLRLSAIRHRPRERDPTVEAMQLGKQEPLPGLLSESERFSQHCVSTRHIAGRHQKKRFCELRQKIGVKDERARRIG